MAISDIDIGVQLTQNAWINSSLPNWYRDQIFMKPVALKIFLTMARTGDEGDLLLMPDLSVEKVINEGGFTGYAHMYEGSWLCFWASEKSIYLTHKGKSVDITNCRGKFRLSIRNFLDLLYRRFTLFRGKEVIAVYDTWLDIDALLDPTYDAIDFESDNFFAWIRYVLSQDNALSFMQAEKPFKP